MTTIERTTWDDEDLRMEFELHAMNTEDVYRTIEWCAAAMAKRAAKGKPNLIEHLEGCSTVAKLTGSVVKLVGGTVSTRQRALLKKDMAKMVWDVYEDRLAAGGGK